MPKRKVIEPAHAGTVMGLDPISCSGVATSSGACSRAGLPVAGETLATMDLVIGATALTREASLLPANEVRSVRVPGLRGLGYR